MSGKGMVRGKKSLIHRQVIILAFFGNMVRDKYPGAGALGDVILARFGPAMRYCCCVVALFNMLVLNSVVGSAVAYPMWLSREPPATPNWLEFPLHAAAFVVLTDVWFYVTHRCMHTKAPMPVLQFTG